MSVEDKLPKILYAAFADDYEPFAIYTKPSPDEDGKFDGTFRYVLVDELRKTLELLKKSEWVLSEDTSMGFIRSYRPRCLSCHRMHAKGHRNDCSLKLEIEKLEALISGESHGQKQGS